MAKLSLKEEEFLALVRGGDIKKIKEYIIKCDEEGYDILNNFPPNSSTPLGVAMYKARVDIVSLLLQYGAECETPMYPSLTPLQAVVLDFCCERKREKQPEFKKIIELLLEYGADPTLKRDEKDTSPLDLAKKYGLQPLLPLFEEAAAKLGKAQQSESSSIEQTGLRYRGDKKEVGSSVSPALVQKKPKSAPPTQEPGYFQGIVNSVYSWFTDSDGSPDSDDDNKSLIESGKRQSI